MYHICDTGKESEREAHASSQTGLDSAIVLPDPVKAQKGYWTGLGSGYVGPG